MLAGDLGPLRDVVIMNAGAALMVAGKAELTEDGANLAREAIDSGRARQALDRLVDISNR